MSPVSGTKRIKVWDLMLSYRHARHKAFVKRLSAFLDEAGVRCWLDLQQIDQSDRLPNEKLREILRQAAKSSRIVVGFPAEDSVALDPKAGRVETVTSWLFWERQFADEVLWVSNKRLYAFPNEYLRLYNLPHLAYLLGIAAGRGMALADFWTKYFAAWPETNRIVWHAGKLHELHPQFLPPMLQPDEPRGRRNAILASSIRDRPELALDHCMEVLE
jgi:hypothetical protein